MVDDILQVASGEDAVLMVLVVFLYIKVHRPVADIGITVVEYFLYQLFLLYNVSCGMRFYRRGQHIECLHRLMVPVGVVLGNLHGLQLLQPGFLGYLVIALIGIVLQMAYVGDVAYIPDLVS